MSSKEEIPQEKPVHWKDGRNRTVTEIPTSGKKGIYEKYIKRPQDFPGSAVLIVLSPVMVATAVLVRTNLVSPVIFFPERAGLNGKIFKLCKFRTIT